MLTHDAARQLLTHYPSLRWIAKHHEQFHWYGKEGGFYIMPKRDGTLTHAEANFPVVIDRQGEVHLPSLGVEDYPNNVERESIAKPPPTRAIAFICNRFYRQTGHTFLYIHDLDHPGEDQIINFNAGDKAFGDFGMHRSIAYYNQKLVDMSDARERGVTSFAGFPISAEQLAVLKADTTMTMLNPDFTYHLLNHRLDAVNCTGYGMTRLQNIGVPLEKLTGRKVKRRIDNDHLPDFTIAQPDALQKTIEREARRAPTRNKFDLQDVPNRDGSLHEFHLAAVPENGLVLGYIGERVGQRVLDDKYISIDIAQLIKHVKDENIICRDGSCGPFSEQAIAALSGQAVNTERQPFRSAPPR